jgi:hypothetical protein
MSKETYRLAKAILLAIFIIGILICAFRFAENGRFVQFDARCLYSPKGNREHRFENLIVDTRNGEIFVSKRQ